MMATPESIAAPIENQGLMDRYLDYIQGDPIAQQVSGGDPLKKALRGISEFIPGISTALAERRGDKFGEALSYLDYLGPAGGGAKLAGMGLLEMISPLIAKYDEQLKKLKFDYDREMRNAQSGDGSAAYEAADKIKKKIDAIERKRSAAIVKEQAKAPTLKTPKQGELDLSAKEGIESLLNKELLVHSSPKTGIKSLQLDPSGSSPGGVYLNRSFSDPRIFDYAEGLVSQGSPKGAAYLTRPRFSKTLDAENIDQNTLSRIDELIAEFQPKGAPTPENTNTQYILQGLSRNKANENMYFPHGFSDELNTTIADLGFDSLRYPTRKGFGKLGESDTVISLSPEETLDIIEEIPFEDIYKRMYELRKYNE